MKRIDTIHKLLAAPKLVCPMTMSRLKKLDTADPFFGPYLKVDRAYQHIGELEAIFGDFLRANEELVSGKYDKKPREDGQRVIGEGFPIRTSAVLGDAVHNLRAALDHAYCILIEANRQAPDDLTYFPFARQRDAVKKRIHGKKGDRPVPNPDVIRCIEDDIQPYDGGKLGLFGLHRLDITDKHKVLIPVALSMKVGALQVKIGGGKNITWAGGTFVSGGNKPNISGFINIGAGGTVKDVGHESTTFSMAFGLGQPFESQGVISKLEELGTTVATVLEMLKSKM